MEILCVASMNAYIWIKANSVLSYVSMKQGLCDNFYRKKVHNYISDMYIPLLRYFVRGWEYNLKNLQFEDFTFLVIKHLVSIYFDENGF